ncbi:transcriptional regulator [Xenorhabdus mauleonii]|uniref:Helix-turn-helix n=1 Tax=Xenorhabdus mauleonii TaxID=351675 RepID=A0A1I3XIE8_9GAMM|nr:helix-turn-helix transcriptional regulator [Xenorhabdus mauleonii]PHM36182.1 transcriptional regulator [Xenorhabdus mauleonii]SFK19303.1 Helix-turn-helix [Xenorhabdus mauleonii]
MLSFGERIKEERKKLGLTQVQFASVGGVQPTTQVNYEKGLRTPDAAYLEKIAMAGCDVLYILTGNRSPAADISSDEQKLIENYRAMNEESRLNMQAVGSAFAQSAPDKHAKNG